MSKSQSTARAPEKHGMIKTREYYSWKAMKQRCFNPKDPGFKWYGARGVTVCRRWRESFVAFYEDMGERPEGMSIDRKNGEGNYSCGKCEECLSSGWTANCGWATRYEQRINMGISTRNKSGYKGVSKKRNGWAATIMDRGNFTYLGTFSTPELAAKAYNDAALRLRGSNAKLNILPG